MKLSVLALAALVTLPLAGCTGNSSPAPASSGPTAKSAGKAIKVGIVFDSGGRGDKSFNDSAWAGVQRAEKELGIPESDVKSVESKFEKDYEGNITGMADSGCDIVFAVGLAQGTALNTVAPKYPNTKFAIIDGSVNQPNVRSIVFNEEQGSFLAGYLAGLVTKSNKIGFVGGQKIPLIEKFQAGYEAGAKTANPAVTILPAKYTESWDDTTQGKLAAQTLYTGGADIVYHAAGRCGLGVIEAAKEANKFVIGVDSDQDGQAPGLVLTSMVKHVDEGVFQTIKDVQDGKFTPGEKRYDLKADGVGLTDFKFTKDKIGQANIDKVKQEASKIKDGSLKVPTSLAEEATYLATLKK
ncbi:MAG TPA: BMP family ABC transporter substrate-binding protein [Fimbriimonas sp.]|nr:BMP family ABC transporter substrate-binding protein [Fimbriimonas sp.]